MSSINNVPSELWLEIFLHMDKKDLYKLSLVCKQFNEVIQSKYFLRHLFKNWSIYFTLSFFEARKEDIKELLNDMVPETHRKPMQWDLNDPRRFYHKGIATERRDLDEFGVYCRKYILLNLLSPT